MKKDQKIIWVSHPDQLLPGMFLEDLGNGTARIFVKVPAFGLYHMENYWTEEIVPLSEIISGWEAIYGK